MVSKTLLVLAVFGAIVFASTPSKAQWVATNGLYRGTVQDLVATEREILVTLQSVGLFRSTNGGSDWSEVTQNYTLLGTDGATIYSLGTADTFCTWTDSGAYWTSRGAPSQQLISPWFGAKDSMLFVQTIDGISRSTDGGLSWKLVSDSPHYYLGSALEGFAAIDSFLFVASDYHGILRSSDNGLHWDWIDTSDDLNLATLAANDGTLFAGSYDTIRLSTDYGNIWKNVSAGLPGAYVSTFAFLGDISFALANGSLLISYDSGSSWQNKNLSMKFNDVSVIGDTIFAGSSADGVFYSVDTGRTWVHISNGLEPLTASTFFVNGDKLFADDYETTDYGTYWNLANQGVSPRASLGPYLFGTAGYVFFRSSNDGESWDTLHLSQNDFIYSILVKDNRIFVGTAYGLFVSSDSGLTWKKSGNGLPSGQVEALCTARNYIVAGIRNGADFLSGIYLSSNDGLTWWKHNDGPSPINVNALAAIDTVLFAGGVDVSRSSINDSGWQDIGPTKNFSQVTVNALLAVDTTLLVGTKTGIFVSNDNGDDWLEKDSGITNPYIDALTQYGNMLFAGTQMAITGSSTPTVWRRPLSEVIDTVHALGIKQTGGDSLWFGNIPIGHDSLKIVTAFNAGKLPLKIQPIPAPQNDFITSDVSSPVDLNPGESFSFTVLFHPSTAGYHSAKLVLASEAKRVIISISGTAFGDDEVEGVLHPIPLLTIAPDPISTSATISLRSASSGYADISIVNLLGTEVAKIFSGETLEGEQHFTWEPTGLPPGIYECLVRMNGRVEKLPVVLQR